MEFSILIVALCLLLVISVSVVPMSYECRPPFIERSTFKLVWSVIGLLTLAVTCGVLVLCPEMWRVGVLYIFVLLLSAVWLYLFLFTKSPWEAFAVLLVLTVVVVVMIGSLAALRAEACYLSTLSVCVWLVFVLLLFILYYLNLSVIVLNEA